MYRIFKYYIIHKYEHTAPRDAECYQYDAANKIDDIVKFKLFKTIVWSSSAGSAAMKGARTR